MERQFAFTIADISPFSRICGVRARVEMSSGRRRNGGGGGGGGGGRGGFGGGGRGGRRSRSVP